MKIKEIPEFERPYEKLERYGAEALTDTELLAIILKSGTKEMTSVQLAQNLFNIKNKENVFGFRCLDILSISELKLQKGIGRVKAIQIKAVVEIAKRIKNLKEKDIKKISSPQDVYTLLANSMENKKQEIIKTILLDRKSVVKLIVTNSLGSQNKNVISYKEILSEPIKQMISRIIVAHNHPSGDTKPSNDDIRFTNKLSEACNMFDIELLDHVIIGNNEYFSFKEKGLV